MLQSLFYLGILGASLQYFLYYRDWASFNQDLVLKVRPGKCHLAREHGGTEDVDYIGDSIVLASAGFNWEGDVGQILAFDISGEKTREISLNISNSPRRADFLGAPHGITTWTDPDTGEVFLYVLTHPKAEDRIEVFEVQKRPVSLRYIRTITDPNFSFMNDLIAVGRDQFYITRYNWYRSGDWIQFAHWSHIKEGTIFYYDGHRARQAVSETYFLSNGISISPDKRTVYMAEWGKKTLHAYRRESNNKLTPLWKEYLDTGIDNINVDQETGNLWIGSHPVTWRILNFYGIFGKQTAPSQVLRVKVSDGGIDAVEEIYSDNGEEIAGSTAAVYAKGKLMIGSVFEQAITCDVKYLSK
ncbi:serum paraoxonase/arylesterase 1-like [Mya arenaria]|uniref:serum paraoxonase/arylesterase 1-like n=1 Tax=Mya arenaria TaxID=6604 RepID=UPI0022E0B17E|nr:serum paraoxonase/arylesterase 1-like [Mya arenaria]